MKHTNIIIHYDELATKGKNRHKFETKLLENIKKALSIQIKKIYKRYGLIVCDLNEKYDENKITGILSAIPGIAYFAFAVKSELKHDKIKEKAIRFIKEKKFSTFRVSARRSNKRFEKTSQQINEKLGELIINKLNKKVKLKDFDLELFIEVGEKEVFLYTQKIKGIGGLPVGVSRKVISSLSGGLDSPVAGYMMMKRGCEVVFVHIYNKTQQNKGVLEKIRKIIKQLNKFQLNSKLYIVPFERIQEEIIINVSAKYRMIIYRRFMMRIINEIAKKEKALGVVTGDSVGQVASQTLENINCIRSASLIPVFSPLIGMNKQEIINLSKKINTYNISIIQSADCCSFNIDKHPETKAELAEIKKIESNIENAEELVKDALKKSKIESFKYCANFD